MRNIAVIDLRTLKNNAEKVRKRLPAGVKFCAVVKADAYGHGACECAAALYKTVDCFAVALVEEGIALRLSGIDKNILVLIPVTEKDVRRAVEYGLTLSVASIKDVSLLEREGKRQNKAVKVHVAYNSGMNRLGVGDEELDGLIGKLKKCRYIKAEGFFSHYACSENGKRRVDSLKRFLSAAKKMQAVYPDIIRHISASGGFICGDYLDMVRIGILLYGYKPFAANINVKPVMRVYSHTVAKRKVKKGELALYGENPLKKDTEFSLVRVGYADGFLRKKSGALINNRCMDMSAIEGKFDGRIMDNAEKIAEQTDTISYEVLCAAACRAEKKYLR